MELFFILTAGFSFSFLSGFLFARILYIRAFKKKASVHIKIISSFKQKYISVFNRNINLEQKIKRMQPNLISLEAMFEKMIVSMN